MFNIGSQELVVILFVILMLFGAKRIPEVARSVGSGMREFRKAMRGIEDELRFDDDRRPPPRLEPRRAEPGTAAPSSAAPATGSPSAASGSQAERPAQTATPPRENGASESPPTQGPEERAS